MKKNIDGDIRDKFLSLEEVLNDEIFERSQEIRGLILASLANKHIFLYGVPGIAKSYLIDRYSARIDGLDEHGFFKKLVAKTTNDSELFGPFSLSKLKEDEFVRIVDGMLPQAYFAFLDEAFRGSSAILNTLLTILEEREFHNGPYTINVPLITMMIAANDLPTSHDLTALADRFHLWYPVAPLREASNMAAMLKSTEKTVEKMISLDEIYKAQESVRNIHIPDAIIEALLDLKHNLGKEGIEISDRRLKQSLIIMQAEAWLNAHDEVEIDDMIPLQFMFWRTEAEISVVRKLVLSVSDPLELSISQVSDDLDRMYASFNRQLTLTDDPQKKIAVAMEAVAKWRAIHNDFIKFEEEEKERARPYPSLKILRTHMAEIVTRICKDGLDEDVDGFEALQGLL